MAEKSAIDEAMEAIGKRIGWINTLRDDEERTRIRQQLEAIAKAARWEALRDAAGQFEPGLHGGIPLGGPANSSKVQRELRRMAEEAKRSRFGVRIQSLP